MSIHDKHKEDKMELSIVEHLANNGWLEGSRVLSQTECIGTIFPKPAVSRYSYAAIA